ncbi:MAG: hypothetical protein DLM53_11530 [Candidatus Eremiobacter antarcticus]|nr:MAG: hypothetical protein DLM53_11530 [Candidatus Eremiobacter sp. RRmetagenome_bin22]
MARSGDESRDIRMVNRPEDCKHGPTFSKPGHIYYTKGSTLVDLIDAELDEFLDKLIDQIERDNKSVE